MAARLFIIVFAPPVLVFTFFYELAIGVCNACIACKLEFTCIKRDWDAKSLTPGGDA